MSVSGKSPVPIPEEIRIHPGPALFSDLGQGPTLAAHRGRLGSPAKLTLPQLVAVTERVRLRGRGGAGFPFSKKLEATAAGRGRPYVVVNLSEGEPASAKDTALARSRPHLILDGAAATAQTLRSREVHVVLPGDRPLVAESMLAAIDERTDDFRWQTHLGEKRFVAGQSRAVIELMAGRSNRPVTSWAPEAIDGHRGRPTLLSNAETWAQLGWLLLVGEPRFGSLGTETEPGTTLLTLNEEGQTPDVVEVAFGTRWTEVLPLPRQKQPSLIGGFHGTWATWKELSVATVSVDGMRALGTPLGAGTVISPGEGNCPLLLTSRVVDYLASQSAQRCGPCRNGLPDLAAALRAVGNGTGGDGEVRRLSSMVSGRGACAHPDGTVRLVASLLTKLPEEVAAHAAGRCATLEGAYT